MKGNSVVMDKKDYYVFDVCKDDFGLLDVEAKDGNCWIMNKANKQIVKEFVIWSNTKNKATCMLKFDQGKDGLYLPRPEFYLKKVGTDEIKLGKDELQKRIPFEEGYKADPFWKLINWLKGFKDLVDSGKFEDGMVAIPKTRFERWKKENDQKFEELRKQIANSDFTEKDLLYNRRIQAVEIFFKLLKDRDIKGFPFFREYRETNALKIKGDEAVWHHFLKVNGWILGLAPDMKFIRDFFDETRVGIENSRGSGSPKVDLLGFSNFTVLIELKNDDANIFTEIKSDDARANTWSFTKDFIEGVSQCLGQKEELERSFLAKDFPDANGILLDKNRTFTCDPRSLFIIGNRLKEFPHDRENDHIIKSKTFERFRRNNRNVDVITYDELFERTFFLVTGNQLAEDWWKCNTWVELLRNAAK
jgi:hypothetical protein